jgi:4-hydroxyphenylpyruvate dioxygenase
MSVDENFVQVSGLSFLEFSGNRPKLLTTLFEKMGLEKGGENTRLPISLYYQGDIRFISNPSNNGNAEIFRSTHGRGACAMGFRVENSEQAFAMALRLGAEAADQTDYDIPAIKGVGKSLIYLVDKSSEQQLFTSFNFSYDEKETSGKTCLERVDHLTHNLNIGGVERMCQFYEKVFGFKRIRSFHIEGKKTGLYSEVVASRCGQVIIPLNESKDDKSQIAEYIREYNGEGIQHIALLSTDIYSTVNILADNGIVFQDTPDTYFDLIDKRLPGHSENIEALKERKILIDGGPEQGGGFLLQIFTQNSIGPIFFEYIQRKGNDGFGEGNFQALFESIELDQERRGVLG